VRWKAGRAAAKADLLWTEHPALSAARAYPVTAKGRDMSGCFGGQQDLSRGVALAALVAGSEQLTKFCTNDDDLRENA
jgi:hypothetical protein